MTQILKTQLLVLGSGPGGYSAAFRAADLGLQVTLVERYSSLGGVCLNVGCIPSKALLHVAQLRREISAAGHLGLAVEDKGFDLQQIRAFMHNSVAKLTAGIAAMAGQRRVRVVQGEGRFSGPHSLQVEAEDGRALTVEFEKAIVAAGSRSVRLGFLPEDPRIWDSTRALQLSKIPRRLLVIGGGIIGLELGTVYQALGSRVTVVEAAGQLIPAADKDLVDVFQRSNRAAFEVRLATRVTQVEARPQALHVRMQDDTRQCASSAEFDAVLVAVGRRPNGDRLDLHRAGITCDARGFIPVNRQMQTPVAHIYAVGDIVGDPMLAHKASHQGHIAAEAAAGQSHGFQSRAMPAIAYTNPEIAWVGLTEAQARAAGTEHRVAIFPWRFSGRALAAHRPDGSTKLIYSPGSGRLLGAGLVGLNAGELLAELALAIEFGATVEDLALTVHAHPTLSESVGLAAQIAAGTITDLPNPKAQAIG